MQTVSDPLKGSAGNMRLIAVYEEPPARPAGSFFVRNLERIRMPEGRLESEAKDAGGGPERIEG